jgi:hypothetical protein
MYLKRLFRFKKEDEIDVRDFAKKTDMNVQSVISMVKQARMNAKLYEWMVQAGYSDEEFPAWWYSPARDAEESQLQAKASQPPAEDAESG